MEPFVTALGNMETASGDGESAALVTMLQFLDIVVWELSQKPRG